MSRWWECKTCGRNLGEFGDQVLKHREGTGHVGAALIMDNCPRPATSTVDARKAALAATAEAIAAAKAKRAPAGSPRRS